MRSCDEVAALRSPTAAVEGTGMAVIGNTDTETKHATDGLLAPPIEERNQRGRQLLPQ